MSQSSALDLPAAHGSDDDEMEFDDDAPLIILCEEVVDLTAITDAPDDLQNQEEAEDALQAASEEACQDQTWIIDRLEHLAKVISERLATSKIEIAAKDRALDALTSIAAWEKDSLRVLRASIQRDWEHLTRKQRKSSLMHPIRQAWLNRQFGGHFRAVR